MHQWETRPSAFKNKQNATWAAVMTAHSRLTAIGPRCRLCTNSGYVRNVATTEAATGSPVSIGVEYFHAETQSGSQKRCLRCRRKEFDAVSVRMMPFIQQMM